jgi:uncharacterized protein (DUF697 family)
VAGRSSLSPQALLRLAKEQRELESKEVRPLVLSGARRPVSALARELSRSAATDSVLQDEDVERAEALVYVLRGQAKSGDLRRLREAGRARVPIICVRIGGGADPLPGVLATDVIELEDAEPVPVEEIGRLLARRLEGRSAALAARIPALRAGVCKELIQRSARRSAAIGVATFVRVPDLPALFLEQARLVLWLGYAHGRRVEPKRGAEIAAVLMAGLGLRRLARRVRHETLFPAWAMQGSIAYTGTLALGEAALRFFAVLGDGNEPGLSGSDRVQTPG